MAWHDQPWDVLRATNSIGCGYIYGIASGNGSSRKWNGGLYL